VDDSGTAAGAGATSRPATCTGYTAAPTPVKKLACKNRLRPETGSPSFGLKLVSPSNVFKSGSKIRDARCYQFAAGENRLDARLFAESLNETQRVGDGYVLDKETAGGCNQLRADVNLPWLARERV